MATIDSGTYYPLVAEDGKWLTVQNCADDTACVSSEDVSRVLILDTAVSKDDVYEGAAVPAMILTRRDFCEPSLYGDGAVL